ncbi:DUF2635 domain-containing protein [Pseudomonas anguilliseptica]|uniref:DUF2635 domain-containing protein n=1 Tax=Pseudomonas anguilliseptica TaxID=53406 RepID=A0A1H5A5M6_PSEAG|nr:DUF2635 domain-containing protein [Pseudomonas anguilliseptica]SED36940.1 Protein of unknown function [Pseudomonas anguilliseptica]
MSKPVYLVPVGELLVRHPQGGYLPAEGDHVVLDIYWRRRMADKSVVKGTPPKTVTAKPAAEKPAAAKE